MNGNGHGHGNGHGNGNECQYGFGTRAIHDGQAPDPTSGAVMTPISLSTTFAQKQPGQLQSKYDYSRSGNPTRDALEECLASLEKAKHGMTFASGLAATTVVFQMLESGSKVCICDDVYGGTNRLLRKVLTVANNLNVQFLDMCDDSLDLADALKDCDLVWIETPTNPNLKVIDVKRICTSLNQSKNTVVAVDNTFATPYFQNPLLLGADLVVHSCTKYLNGHSDVVMGCVCTNREDLHDKLRFLQNATGAVPSAFDCYLVLRSLKTLHIRMERHQSNAMAVAEMLSSHPRVKRVHYPGLKSHPNHITASKQMQGYSGMVTFWIRASQDKDELACATEFLKKVKIFTLAESLGGVESLVEHPAIMTHASVPAAQRKELGIDDSMIRLSVGIEDIGDILSDLTHALE